MATPLSGELGAVDGEHTVGLWTVSSSQDLKKIVASNTDNMPLRLAGKGDWSGRFEAWAAQSAVLPGDIFTFTGSMDGSLGATGAAIVDSFELTIDIEAGEVVKHVVTFSSNGALTLGSSVAADATTPDPDSSVDCSIQVSDPLASPSYADLINITTITIRISADNVAYSDSDTASETKRLKGPLDASISYTQNIATPATFLAKGTTHQFKVFVNATEFWEFEFGMVEAITDVEVNMETNAVIKGTVNVAFTGYTNIATVATKGTILKPTGGAYWP